MKFSEMPYTRPDVEAIGKQMDELAAQIAQADSAAAQIAAYDRCDEIVGEVFTDMTLAYVRHTIDTRDEFYDKENEYCDEIGPVLESYRQKVGQAMLESAFRKELEAHYGALLFTNLEIAARAFKPEIMELMQEENRLASEYQKLYASAMVDFRGETLPLPKLGPYKQSTDRATRKAAFEAEGAFFDAHQTEFDELYTKLVQCRNKQARALGHKNYIQLGYDRLGRNCYGYDEIRSFREQIAADLVPVVAKIKQEQKKRLGLEKMYYYDDTMLFADGNATPEGTADEIMAAGKRMYHELSAETAEFIDAMFDADLFDVLSKPGKAPGGYCTSLPRYKMPIIFSNFNGTAGDVDVLTHEAGHAFADYRAYKKQFPMALQSPTIEACECHSMSMEFLTQDYHKYFFGKATRKYELGHCEDALCFIPYGCMVDEFQHLMYENEDMTPAERNETWLALEKKYRPWIDFESLPFYARGAGWQRQLHIYLYPLYYIDYCMAQTVAFQFWMESLENRAAAWKRYLAFVDEGGGKTFAQLCESADIRLPYAEGSIRAVGEKISRWIDENPLD